MAADSGARRGELVALRFTDLEGRTLQICRSVSGEEITVPKSGHARSLTIGSSTARLWHTLATDAHRAVAPVPLGPWVFTSDLAHQQRLTVGALGHRFARLRDTADVPGASLHRLRHSVATFLVARGEILQAQARLGHADAATTLREYAYALPRTDGDIADAINRHLERAGRAQRHDRSTPLTSRRSCRAIATPKATVTDRRRLAGARPWCDR